ncbi:MAG: rod shape-determining protein MreC [Pseudanabaena sp.]|jgi:rod shape-determining protein MreC|uniref:rod shape-determining protein MreC n=1 Tax=Cyanophyceae TaxID=3028117 RepID=UPI0025768A0B|nr:MULTISPECIES: rod shape-determining protein MreC [Cyanophyceae]MCA6574396.1 rod shape-determining protein MreC [Pseudanabaena sp. M53BS1SP1A06MG]MCA6585979.1 rod shape-determining protein MreC [Pseudanabaena sp. M051S1SP1A06QC]MCA6587973.1 rod shape-determining protein MreC [Pseudanabaena sp. M109S1SP1A06QC]MCA6591004.1 rod shape-determining protein MreC [Pseudanabaena sp. M38BS1SP1A06MG]MCA6598042.1 rod shape-determining protein MreC [Pseudanabaena sp. M046S1SP1A06QC]MCA6598790.1 rod shap
MDSIRSWWERYSFQTAIVTVGIGLAWVIRQTQGVVIMETYQFLSKPFQPSVSKQELLQDAQVRELKYRLTELESQNQRMKELLKVTASSTDAGVWATVIGRGADSWWNQILIGKGSNDGIRAGAVVVAPGGLVGRVTHVSPNSSQILLVSDPNSQVGVIVSRSRFSGMLKGQSQNTAILEFFERDPDVKVGDIVHTSQFSTLFPENVPVGRIKSINLDKQPSPEAIVEFSSPLGLLEYVRVYPFQDKR